MRLLFSLLFLVATLNATDLSGFKNLFNGNDLSGWEGDFRLWSVREGAITGQTTREKPATANTFLIWNGGEVRNFELRVSFRLVADNPQNSANSGIQYRSRVIDRANFSIGGYQGDMDGDDKYTGMLYEEQGRGIIAKPGEQVRLSTVDGKTKRVLIGVATPPTDIAKAIHSRGWNDYVIVAEGSHLRHFINGTLTADVVDVDEPHAAKSGILALQLHTGPPMTVQFRNIRLKTLP